LPLSGGTMTGPLSVLDPTQKEHAANKEYVDYYFRLAFTGHYVPISGNRTLTGPLTVLTPTLCQHAANKAYVDSKVIPILVIFNIIWWYYNWTFNSTYTNY